MSSDIDQVIRRTRRYWYEDGFAELASGAIMTLAGIGLAGLYQFILVSQSLPWDSPWRWMIALGVVVAAEALAVVGLRRLRGGVEAAKQRVTYPRTGYVAYSPPPQPKPASLPRKIAGFVLIMGVSMLAGNVVARVASSGLLPIWLLSMPMSMGLLAGLALVILGRRMALPRFYGLAALSVLAAMLAALGDLASVGAMRYLVLMGLVPRASGAIVLGRYLRANTPPEDGEEGGDGG